MPALTSISAAASRRWRPWMCMEATRAQGRFHHLRRRAALRRIGAGVMGFVQQLELDRRPFCGLV